MMKAFLRCILFSLPLLLGIVVECHARRRPPSSLLFQPRIVGGNDAQRNEFPYFVQMGLCGGTLIAPGVVLSAAHCREIFDIGVTVTIEPYEIKDLSSRRVKIVERHFHPWFDDEWAMYDMILLRLEEPIYFDDSQVQLRLNDDRNFPPDDTALTAIGFGYLKEGVNRFPDVLQKVEMTSMNLDICNRTLYGYLLDDSFMCAGTQEGGKDTCQGDSGGPLIHIDGNQHTLVGLVSWGEGCGIPGMPGAYARVSKGMSWIKKMVCECWNVQGASFCSSSDDVTAEKRSSSTGEEELIFECPIQVDPNCQDTPGYVDYVGDVCSWHEEWENPGCVDHGDSPGGSGFEDTNALSECCWCGGGSIVEPPSTTTTPVKFERHPECKDVEGWTDQFSDGCEWYEANTAEGTCDGWGSVPGDRGMRTVTADTACCHCGGGKFPTPPPSPSDGNTGPTPPSGNKPNKAPSSPPPPSSLPDRPSVAPVASPPSISPIAANAGDDTQAPNVLPNYAPSNAGDSQAPNDVVLPTTTTGGNQPTKAPSSSLSSPPPMGFVVGRWPTIPPNPQDEAPDLNENENNNNNNSNGSGSGTTTANAVKDSSSAAGTIIGWGLLLCWGVLSLLLFVPC